MSWPTPQDYNEAVQNPQWSFADSTLSRATPVLNALGLPQPSSGNFASVYRLISDNKSFAVRCFLRPVTDQAERYAKLSDYILNDDLACTVDFHFLDRGIKVQNQWYPMLKMEWIEGLTLDQYIRKNWRDSQKIEKLACDFKNMLADLGKAAVAHGDLQHGNIMVIGSSHPEDTELRLVDYDDFYVPALLGHSSNALGHKNYQHPARSRSDYGAYVDNFSAWIIYTSLLALSLDPDLCVRLSDWDDCLLFDFQDFLEPEESMTFRLCSSFPDERIRLGANYIREALEMEPSAVAGLDSCDFARTCTQASPRNPTRHDNHSSGEPWPPGDSSANSSSDSGNTVFALDQPDCRSQLRLRAQFAEPDLKIVEAEAVGLPSYLADIVSLEEEQDQDSAHIAEIVESIVVMSEVNMEALCKQRLDLDSYAGVIRPSVEQAVGHAVNNDMIVKILRRIALSIVPHAPAAKAPPPMSHSRIAVAQMMANERAYRFSSKYLSERLRWEQIRFWTFVTIMALVIFAPGQNPIPGVIAACALMRHDRRKSTPAYYERLSQLLQSLEPIPSTVLVEIPQSLVNGMRAATGRQLPVLEVTAGGGSNSWGRKWLIENRNFERDLPGVTGAGPCYLDLYFDPQDGRPIAILKGSQIVWLI